MLPSLLRPGGQLAATLTKRLVRGAVLGLVVAVAVVAAWLPGHLDTVAHHGDMLASVAGEAAARLDAAAHARVHGPEDAGSPEFLTQRDVLREVQHAHDLGTPLYTLRATDDGRTRFVVMTNPTPFIGDAYLLRDDMRPVFAGAEERATTGLYGDDHGDWISGYAAVRGADEAVEAIVSVDRPSGDLAAERLRMGLLAMLLGGLVAAFAAFADLRLLRDVGLVQAVRRVAFGSLATRIGLAGSVVVMLAVGIVAALDHRAAERELVEHSKHGLTAAVQLGAHLVDPALHVEVGRTGDAATPAFHALQGQLRRIQHAADLQSPVYTLRRDGELVRFVGMTNEQPFVGDPYELRPGVRATFEGAGLGTDGPYTDAHGTWISAWAPLLDDTGRVVGVLQADQDVGAAVAALWNRTLARAVFALVGVGVAFLVGALLARSIALPVRRVAAAARDVGAGRYDIDVPSDRTDEVGELARAVQQMASGLAEKERLRDMFGKYMATQVVQDLLDQGEVRLEGELREVTVLITDIRGYTALTEALGATEVVALLNEYFSILVEVVLAHDGVIDKFMGDALLCWFGAPVPQEDHASRAVAAARDMMERTGRWNTDRVARGLPPVATGIGIALGQVVVGNIGSPRRLEYTAIGDAVNLASRLCGQAEAGEVRVTEGVRAATGEAFEVVGDVQVKGVSAPVPVLRRQYPVVAA